MKRMILALPLALAACATPPPVGSPVIAPSLTQDAAECGIALALAGVTGGVGSIAGAALGNAACMRLPADILAQVEGHATVKANQALRTLRRIP